MRTSPGQSSVFLKLAGFVLLLNIVLLSTWLAWSAANVTDRGPGGPILILTSSANPFTRYYAEILRAEGFNEFTAIDISGLPKQPLNDYDVVILGEMSLTPDQVTVIEEYVKKGGNLIAMRPDRKLAGMLGLTATSSAIADKYVLLEDVAGSESIVHEPIQFHGTADDYDVGDATSLATLYSSSTTATAYPAVTLRHYEKGQAAAFTFDLARSIVYTRQGNPAWQGQLRDTNPGCQAIGAQPCETGSVLPPIQPHNLFFGNARFDPQPEWIDFSKIAIPQADEQQRFLANLILRMNDSHKPLPRFWYFPRGKKAIVVMTGDGHTGSNPAAHFDKFAAMSPANCSLADWECVRSTAFIYSVSSLSNGQAAAYTADGFEVSIHLNTNCANWTTEAALHFFYLNQLADWQITYTGLTPPSTNRTHCIVWSDYTTQASVESRTGMRFDTSYYYYPGSWVQDRPGFFTGSGMPMRFARRDGSTIDMYQAATQMTDQSFQTFPFTIDALLDRAIGPEGYYGAFTANMHVDHAPSPDSEAIVTAAQARGVPVVSAKQMLTWIDGRNGSSFRNLTWDNRALDFEIAPNADAIGIQAMLPTISNQNLLVNIMRNGSNVPFTKARIKGIEYALFPAQAGSYSASYEPRLNLN